MGWTCIAPGLLEWKNRLFEWVVSLKELKSPSVWLSSCKGCRAAGRVRPHCPNPLSHAGTPAHPGSPSFALGNWLGSRRVPTDQWGAVVWGLPGSTLLTLLTQGQIQTHCKWWVARRRRDCGCCILGRGMYVWLCWTLKLPELSSLLPLSIHAWVPQGKCEPINWKWLTSQLRCTLIYFSSLEECLIAERHHGEANVVTCTLIVCLCTKVFI